MHETEWHLTSFGNYGTPKRTVIEAAKNPVPVDLDFNLRGQLFRNFGTNGDFGVIEI